MQRKKTLFKEYEEKDRAGGIIDRRFGENDPTMSIEEKMLERFTKERQRASKGAAFNLEDEEELTHYGQSLSKMDDFDNVGLGSDSDEEKGLGMYQVFLNLLRFTLFQVRLTERLSVRPTLEDSVMRRIATEK